MFCEIIIQLFKIFNLSSREYQYVFLGLCIALGSLFACLLKLAFNYDKLKSRGNKNRKIFLVNSFQHKSFLFPFIKENYQNQKLQGVVNKYNMTLRIFYALLILGLVMLYDMIWNIYLKEMW